MGFYQLKKEQELHCSLNELWSFICDPRNLQTITPPDMGFDILHENDLPEKMYEGMIIQYHVSPFFGIKTHWVTEITNVREEQFFVDEQRVGPYALWHHQHHLKETENGVLMTDIVSYKPPMGILGCWANSLFISRKLNQIFDYREKVLDGLYNV